jgi:signal transduction histidine kinase
VTVSEPIARWRALVRTIEEEAEAQRAELARLCHDDIVQTLTAVRFQLEAVGEAIARESAAPALAGLIHETSARLQDLARRVQRASAQLHPMVLELAGLRAAIDWRLRQFAADTAVPARLAAGAEVDLPPEQARQAYRIVSDELASIEQGAAADAVHVEVAAHGGGCVVSLEVRRPASSPTAQAEVRTLRPVERARRVSGAATIEDEAGVRRVVVQLPGT